MVPPPPSFDCFGGGATYSIGTCVQILRPSHLCVLARRKVMVTTGDYSVGVRELRDGMDPSDRDRLTAEVQEQELYADLEELGFGREKIAQATVMQRPCNGHVTAV